MRIGIIGTGLIGGSLGLVLKKSKKYKVYCYNRRLENSRNAVKAKAADEYFESIEELSRNSDVVIIATPLSTYKDITKRISKHLDGKKIISDVGSVKYEPTEEALKNIPVKYKSFFVPAHPIAGKEKGGLSNASADLYKGKKLIICKTANCKKGKVVASIWKDAGAEIELMSASKHDEIYAYISHYVQYLSFICTHHLPKSLGDFSRLMSSPKDIWAEIFEYNSDNLRKINAKYIKALEKNIKTLKTQKAQDVNYFAASVIAQTLQQIVPAEYVKYAGSGYKSFTSAVKTANSGAQHKADAVKIILGQILDDLQEAKL